MFSSGSWPIRRPVRLGPYVWGTHGAAANLTRADDPATPLLAECNVVAEPAPTAKMPLVLGDALAA